MDKRWSEMNEEERVKKVMAIFTWIVVGFFLRAILSDLGFYEI